MLFLRQHRRSLIFSVFVLLFTVHYYHWDDRLVQLIKESQISLEEQQTIAWFDDYTVVIEAKPIAQLLKDETSGLAWREQSNTLFTITGKRPYLAELSLTGDLLRKISLKHISDPESVEVLSDGRFAVVDERKGILFIFSVPEQGSEIDLAQAIQIDLTQMDAKILLPKNKNIEGLTWDERNSQFILAKERNPIALYSLPYNLANDSYGTLQKLPTDDLFVRDLSGLAMDYHTGNLLVLSQESNLLITLNRLSESMNFMSFAAGVNGLKSRIKQAEGVAIDKKGTLYIVSEPNLFYTFEPAKPFTAKHLAQKYNAHFVQPSD